MDLTLGFAQNLGTSNMLAPLSIKIWTTLFTPTFSMYSTKALHMYLHLFGPGGTLVKKHRKYMSKI